MIGAREVFPGVHCIELPLPWELETVNAYLVRLDDGYLLVDAGVGTQECFDAMRSALDSFGAGFQDVKQIFVTHFHPDHAGLAAQIQEISGASVVPGRLVDCAGPCSLWMHPNELDHLRVFGDPAKGAAMRGAALTIAGVPAELQQRMQEVFAAMRIRYREIHAIRQVSGGEAIASGIGPLEVVWTPGHSPGHICLYQREKRLFFSGDHMLPGITPNISWMEGHDSLGDYLASLRKVDEFEVDLVLPGHGRPFSGHREWTRKTIAHHEDRCARLMELLGGLPDGEPKTAHELTQAMWRPEIHPLHHFLAALEVLAHLESMRRRGEVMGRLEEGALRWARAYVTPE